LGAKQGDKEPRLRRFDAKQLRLLTTFDAAPELALMRKRQGRCYKLAALAMLNEPDAEQLTLLHGTVCRVPVDQMLANSPIGCAWINLPIGHAWIETADGRIYDPTTNCYTPANQYVRERCPTVHRCFTRQEVMRLVLATKKWGPWTNDQIRDALAEHA
jgi:hypothetical protein